ncbi:MAG: hypothetical protein M1835_006418 [Candelina submexicana]|nr:MAG: hypothetical protein M1835_006418 [Candelina submexicana]
MFVAHTRLSYYHLITFSRFFFIFLFIDTIASRQLDEDNLRQSHAPIQRHRSSSLQSRFDKPVALTPPIPFPSRLFCPGNLPSSGYPPNVNPSEYNTLTTLCTDAGCYCKDDYKPACALNFDVDAGTLGADEDELWVSQVPLLPPFSHPIIRAPREKSKILRLTLPGSCSTNAFLPWGTSSEEQSQNSPTGTSAGNSPMSCKETTHRKMSMCRSDGDCCEGDSCKGITVAEAVKGVLFGAVQAIEDVGSCVLPSALGG